MPVEILHAPKALVLEAPGINRQEATKSAYEAAGARAEIVHVNQLLSQEVSLSDYQIVSIPGGFSYGDHIQSGVILALQLRQNVLADQIYGHLQNGRLILGVCNGFQVLVQSGLLPFGEIHPRNQNVTTLTYNQPHQFQSRWIYLQPESSRCSFVPVGEKVTYPVAHGEGKFLAIDSSTAMRLEACGQVVYRYCTAQGEESMQYPENPNGSSQAIAAICDPSGQILGVMPHAEDFVSRYHHPNWRREDKDMPVDGLTFFQNVVAVAKGL